MRSNRIGMYIALVFLCPSICIAANPSDDNLVNVRISCKEQGPTCSKFIVADTKKEILLQNKPVITLADVDSAEFKTQDNSAHRIAYLESKGVSEEEAKKRMYGLILKFKTPHVLYKITSQNVGKIIAVFIGNELVTAPYIATPISGNSATIMNGHMTKEKAELLTKEINEAVASDRAIQ